jgi:hypothetical protein
MTRLSIPLSAKPGKHRIAVDTVDLQQAKTSLKHKNLIYVLGWFLNVFDLQYDS